MRGHLQIEFPKFSCFISAILMRLRTILIHSIISIILISVRTAWPFKNGRWCRKWSEIQTTRHARRVRTNGQGSESTCCTVLTLLLISLLFILLFSLTPTVSVCVSLRLLFVVLSCPTLNTHTFYVPNCAFFFDSTHLITASDCTYSLIFYSYTTQYNTI